MTVREILFFRIYINAYDSRGNTGLSSGFMQIAMTERSIQSSGFTLMPMTVKEIQSLGLPVL